MCRIIIRLGLAFVVLGAPTAAVADPDDPPASSTVPPPPAAPSPGPTVTGVAQQGRTLTGDQGVWGIGVALTNQWRRCDDTRCAPTGQSGRTYTLTADDVGKRMKLRVRGTNMVGGFREADSPLTAVVTPPSQNPPSPPPKVSPSKLDPFPVVVVAGRQGERSTKVSELSVRGPRKARVVVRCLGKRCPLRGTAAAIPQSKRLRVRKAQRVYRAGLVLEIRVTGADRVGKYTKVRFRGGRTPARTDACLQPGASKPSACQ